MVSPYFGVSFFEFFVVLFGRIGLLCQGQIAFSDLASDEIQVAVLLLASMSSALIGTFLVLKKMTMVANSLSHTVLLGIVISYLLASYFLKGELLSSSLSLPVLFLSAIITGVVTTICTQMLTSLMKIQEDASIGLVFTTLFALGVVLVTIFTRNAHLGIEAVTGNVDALHFDDFKLMLGVTAIELFVFLLFFPQFVMLSFDASFASCIGLKTKLFTYLLMILVAASVIASFRAIGILLVLSLLVGPVLTARLFVHKIRLLLAVAMGLGMASSLCAVALSRHMVTVYDTPVSTSGLVVLMIAGFFVISLFLCPKGRAFFLKKAFNLK